MARVFRAAGVAAICGVASLCVVATACGAAARSGSSPRARGSRRPAGEVRLPRGSSGPGDHVRPRRALAGTVIGIDPGHNGRNRGAPSYLSQLIWNGREWEACDTAGTRTDGGYTEARFTYSVARYLRADLRRAGARVVLTRTNNVGVGPCVNTRSFILNRAHSTVAIDIHADGGPAWGRGFTILLPVADRWNRKVIGASVRFGRDVRAAMLRYTKMPVSDYYGQDGLEYRNDLAGLNLTTVPKVLIECGNMRNATDARLLTSPAFQRRLARALQAAIVAFASHR